MNKYNAKQIMLIKLIIVAVGMFGFGFLLVPFYKKICEATGIYNIIEADAAPLNTQIDASREITIELDANVRDQLPWTFKPKVTSLKAHPGQLIAIEYELVNQSSRMIVGQAIPSYSPINAAAHFKKLECFCFRQQTIKAGETRSLPVTFMVDRDLPNDVNTVTLSYTFYEVNGTARAS